MNQILKLLISSLFFILPFGQLTRLPIPHLSINIYLHDLIISFILLCWLSTKPKKLPPLTKPISLFILTALASLIIASFRLPLQSILISSLYLIRWSIYASLYFVLSDKNLNKLPLKKLLVTSASLLAIFSLAQYIFLPDTRFLKVLDWDDHYYRVISTLGDPTFVGIILVLALILLPTLNSPWWFYPLFLLPLLLTYSRSSYLSLLAAAITTFILKTKSKIFLLITIFLLIALPFLPRPGGEGVKLERRFSITQRLANYQEGITLFKQSPIFGIGFNTLRFYRHDQTSHAAAGLDSSLLFVLTTSGIIGLLAYLNLLKHLWQTSGILKISLSALLIHSLFSNSLFYPYTMIWLWVLLATEYS